MNQVDREPRLPCPVGPAGRAWIEARLGWILDRFGSERVRRAPVASPDELLAEGFDGSPDAAFELFERVRDRLDLAEHDLRFELYDESGPDLPEWATHDGVRAGTAGHFVRAEPHRPQLVRLELGQLDDPEGVVATLAHELGHVLLIGQDRLTGDEADQEPLTDLLTVFLGFGVFTANSVIRERNTATHWSVGRLGYLRQEEFAYALALFARLRGEARPVWVDALCTDVRAWFDESAAWLVARGWSSDDADAARREARELGALDYAALWAGAADEEPTTEARVPWGVVGLVLGLLGLCLSGLVLPGWLAARTRPLHVINVTPWPATVVVDGVTHEVEPGLRAPIELGDGEHEVVLRTPLGEERLTVELGPPRTGHRPTVHALNVLGAAAIVEEMILYGTKTGAEGPPPTVHWGRTLVVIEGVDDAFRPPPERVSVRGGGPPPPRRWLRVHGQQGPLDQALTSLHTFDPAAAHGLLELRRRLEPAHPALGALEWSWREHGD